MGTIEATLSVKAPVDADVESRVAAWRAERGFDWLEFDAEPSPFIPGYTYAVDLWIPEEHDAKAVQDDLADFLPWKATPDYVLDAMPHPRTS